MHMSETNACRAKVARNLLQSVQTLCFVAADTAAPRVMYLACRHAAAVAEEPH